MTTVVNSQKAATLLARKPAAQRHSGFAANTRPMPAMNSGVSSFTSSSAPHQKSNHRRRSSISASMANARKAIAKQASWKSKFNTFKMPQDSAKEMPM